MKEGDLRLFGRTILRPPSFLREMVSAFTGGNRRSMPSSQHQNMRRTMKDILIVSPMQNTAYYSVQQKIKHYLFDVLLKFLIAYNYL